MSNQKEHKNAVGKDGKLKPKYKDEPRYKTIFGYEGAFKDAFSKSVKNMSKDIVKEVISLAKVKKNR